MKFVIKQWLDENKSFQGSGDEYKAHVALFLASWTEVPAGSVPDDDHWLAQNAGYGRDVTSWKAAKAGALHGWQRCKDGRFYHPIVSEVALNEFMKKPARRKQTETGRLVQAAMGNDEAAWAARERLEEMAKDGHAGARLALDTTIAESDRRRHNNRMHCGLD